MKELGYGALGRDLSKGRGQGPWGAAQRWSLISKRPEAQVPWKTLGHKHQTLKLPLKATGRFRYSQIGRGKGSLEKGPGSRDTFERTVELNQRSGNQISIKAQLGPGQESLL